MASIPSMISFFVLLLATYSYSAPIVPEFETSTVEYEVINATLIDESNSTIVPITSIYIKSGVKSNSNGSTSSEESHSEEVKIGFTHSPRTYEDSSYATETDLNELSTVEDSSSIVMIPKRGIDVSSFTDATETTEQRDIEDSSSTGMSDKRSLEESSDSTVTDLNESSTVEDSSSIEMIPKRGIDVSSFTDATETTEQRDIEDSSSTGMSDKRSLEESSDSTVTDSNESNSVEDSSSMGMIPKRSLEESSDSTVTDLNESSTVEDSSSIEMIPKRGVDVLSFTDATETTEQRDIEDSSFTSSTGINDKRTVEDFLFTTIESSTEFNQRAIRPVQSVQEQMESSTIVSSEYQPEMSTVVQPLSSVDSFVNITGLLRDQPSATVEYETTSQTEEDFTTQSPVTSESVTKILSIIPGTISETKIVISRPAEVPVVIQRVDQKQLSQGGNQSIIEETKSDN